MSELPILFSGPMVRAILEGRKTQTRRLVKPQPVYVSDATTWEWSWKDREISWKDDGQGSRLLSDRCPYGAPGDRLYVRETWMAESNLGIESNEVYPPPFSDGRPIKTQTNSDWGEWWSQCHYRATDPKPVLVDDSDSDRPLPWRPSIHMPKWATRIWLEVTARRVEQLRDISEADAWGEGYRCDNMIHVMAGVPCQINLNRFREGDWAAPLWDANPWVWVVEFKRTEAPS